MFLSAFVQAVYGTPILLVNGVQSAVPVSFDGEKVEAEVDLTGAAEGSYRLSFFDRRSDGVHEIDDTSHDFFVSVDRTPPTPTKWMVDPVGARRGVVSALFSESVTVDEGLPVSLTTEDGAELPTEAILTDSTGYGIWPRPIILAAPRASLPEGTKLTATLTPAVRDCAGNAAAAARFDYELARCEPSAHEGWDRVDCSIERLPAENGNIHLSDYAVPGPKGPIVFTSFEEDGEQRVVARTLGPGGWSVDVFRVTTRMHAFVVTPDRRIFAAGNSYSYDHGVFELIDGRAVPIGQPAPTGPMGADIYELLWDARVGLVAVGYEEVFRWTGTSWVEIARADADGQMFAAVSANATLFAALSEHDTGTNALIIQSPGKLLRVPLPGYVGGLASAGDDALVLIWQLGGSQLLRCDANGTCAPFASNLEPRIVIGAGNGAAFVLLGETMSPFRFDGSTWTALPELPGPVQRVGSGLFMSGPSLYHWTSDGLIQRFGEGPN